MDIIKMTRELGAAIQTDPDYIELIAARDANDADEALQKQIEKFNLINTTAEYEMGKDNVNDARVEELNNQLEALYNEIMAMPSMARFQAAKDKMDDRMNYLIAILAAAVNGEDPMTFDPEAEHECGGDCGHCHGCH